MYKYPVEEAYRFHFKSPRDISPRREEVRIPKPVYYSYRKAGPGKQEAARQVEPRKEATDQEAQNKVNISL